MLKLQIRDAIIAIINQAQAEGVNLQQGTEKKCSVHNYSTELTVIINPEITETYL